MKTSIISIPPLMASRVLEQLESNSVKCKYIGLDLSKKMIMELSYIEEQHSVIGDVVQIIAEHEKMLLELTQLIAYYTKKRNQINQEQ